MLSHTKSISFQHALDMGISLSYSSAFPNQKIGNFGFYFKGAWVNQGAFSPFLTEQTTEETVVPNPGRGQEAQLPHPVCLICLAQFEYKTHPLNSVEEGKAEM